MVKDTGSGWTLQNSQGEQYLDIEGDLKNGTKVVAVQTDNPRTWDIQADEQDNNVYRQVNNGILQMTSL
jgi:hypothetical protein